MSAVTEKNKIETQYFFGELFSKHLSMYSMTREFIFFSFKACVEAAVANKCQIVLISCVCVWEGAESNHLFCHEEKNKNKQISLTCEEKQKRGSCLPRQCRVSKSVNTGSRQLTILYRILKAVCLKPVFKLKYSSPKRFHKCPKFIFSPDRDLKFGSDYFSASYPHLLCNTIQSLFFFPSLRQILQTNSSNIDIPKSGL